MLKEELQIKFNDTITGKTFTLRVLDPNEELLSADIEDSAMAIIASNVFGEGLVLESAQIVRTTVTEVEI